MSKNGLVIGSVLLVILLTIAVPGASANGIGSQICGAKFDDKNSNGLFDNGDSGLAGWTIRLEGVATAFTVPIPVHMSTITDGNGVYCFSGLPGGTYTLFEIPKPGWIPTTSMIIGPFDVPNTPVVFDFANFGNKKIFP